MHLDTVAPRRALARRWLGRAPLLLLLIALPVSAQPAPDAFHDETPAETPERASGGARVVAGVGGGILGALGFGLGGALAGGLTGLAVCGPGSGATMDFSGLCAPFGALAGGGVGVVVGAVLGAKWGARQVDSPASRTVTPTLSLGRGGPGLGLQGRF